MTRKMLFLATLAGEELAQMNRDHPPVDVMQFDDLETCVQTKCKPVSVTLALEEGSRRIIGFEVAEMPANGKLAERARKRYGPREDKRAEKRRALFERIQPFVEEGALIKSDQNPHYVNDVKKYFPHAFHEAVKGRKPRSHGQDELKKGYDPIFSLNHTFAMLRANATPLIRKTWCVSKKIENLRAHLMLYVLYHNTELI